jgi:hypothetical protein
MYQYILRMVVVFWIDFLGGCMGLLRASFLSILVVLASTWAYAPIRMTPDEIEPENRQVLSGIKYQKKVAIEVRRYFFFNIERKREYYEISFNVHDDVGEPLCSLRGNIVDGVRYGRCDDNIAKIQIQEYEAPEGTQKFLNIDVYDQYQLRASKKVLLRI